MASEKRFCTVWLLVVTGIAVALRFYDFFQIPYTHDELSALNRTHFQNLSELIRMGVAVDGHPAGVQVFLYYWIRLFGTAEWIVKLPFLVMGVLCVPLIYKIGREWFGPGCGLIAATLMAMLQSPVMYSQEARPYSAGLFFVLSLVLIWNRLMHQPRWWLYMAFTVNLVVCAYIHYFSLVEAVCIGLTGIFLIPANNRWKYLLSILLSLVLFTPHIKVSLRQFALGGLAWLVLPTKSYIINYLFYIFNSSYYIIAVLLLMLLPGLVLAIKNFKSEHWRYRGIALLWFLLPFITGYLFSVYRAPILQYPVLFFAFPFLLLFLSSFALLRPWRNLQMMLLVTVLFTSLVAERKYYTLFYHAETETFAQYIMKCDDQFGAANIACAMPRGYINFYENKYNRHFNYVNYDTFTNCLNWRGFVSRLQGNYLLLCNPPQEWGQQYLAVAREYFPYLREKYEGFADDIFILQRDTVGAIKWPKPLYTAKSDGGTIDFTYPVNRIARDKNDKIDLSVEISTDSEVPLKSSLALDFLGKNGEVLQHIESRFADYAGAHCDSCHVYLTSRLHHAPVKETRQIHVYMKKGEGENFKVMHFLISTSCDNQVFYTLAGEKIL